MTFQNRENVIEGSTLSKQTHGLHSAKPDVSISQALTHSQATSYGSYVARALLCNATRHSHVDRTCAILIRLGDPITNEKSLTD